MTFVFPLNCNEYLKKIADSIPNLILKSIAKNTIRSYSQGFRAWNNWRRLNPGINKLPVHEAHLALFVVSAIQSNSRYGKINNVYCGLNWLHNVVNLPNPCDSTLIQALKESAKRLLSRPVKKKEPIKPRDLKRLTKLLRSVRLSH